MRIGAVFPQTEIGDDPMLIRAWAQEVERLGYDTSWLRPRDRGRRRQPGRAGVANTSETAFHESSSVRLPRGGTSSVELVTGVLNPAAAADRAGGQAGRRGGRAQPRPTAAGVGVGWNPVETTC